jgi:hypothetical protein
MIRLSSFDFERGPIRPPSEARSLFVRVERNCPWNRCTFCPVYKSSKFEPRAFDDVLSDICTIRKMIHEIHCASSELGFGGRVDPELARELFRLPGLSDSYCSVIAWLCSDSKNVFLQDADPLVMKTPDLSKVIEAIRDMVPAEGRITAYSRSCTTARLGVSKLLKLRSAGLSRIHTGLETGNAEILSAVSKGTTPAQQVLGGLNVRNAGMELSLYVMPGLGGRALSREHARDTASVISRIEPDFIRLRTLAIPPGIPLYELWRTNRFQPLSDEEILGEIRLLIENLRVKSGRLESDHILNLLSDLEGELPKDIPFMIQRIDRILALPEEERTLFKLGRRLGVLRNPEDLSNEARRTTIKQILSEWSEIGIDPDEGIKELMMRFI